MNEYSENILVQESAGRLLHDELGWDVATAYNQEVLGENGTFGRKSYREVLLKRHVRQALRKLNPWMNDTQVEQAIGTLETRLSTASLMQVNEEKYRLVRDGIDVTVKNAKGEPDTRKAMLINFGEPTENHFLAIKEMKIHGELYRRRTDIVGYVNGLPLLSQLTEFSKSENLYETTVGNGRLTPYRMNKNLVMAAYDLGERYLALQINCDHSPHIIADRRVIRENDTVIYSFDNNQDHTRLEVDLYAESYFFNKKIHFYVMPCFTREVVRGDYTHRNTHFSVTAGGHAYIGNFTVACNYISPAESLQGETLARQSGSTDFSCAYRHRRLSIKLGMRNLFNSHGSSTRIRRLSDMVSGVNETCNKAFGNMFYCSLSWNLVKGKESKPDRMKKVSVNMDDGIIR